LNFNWLSTLSPWDFILVVVFCSYDMLEKGIVQTAIKIIKLLKMRSLLRVKSVGTFQIEIYIIFSKNYVS